MEIQELEVLSRFQALQFVLRQIHWPALISLRNPQSVIVPLCELQQGDRREVILTNDR